MPQPENGRARPWGRTGTEPVDETASRVLEPADETAHRVVFSTSRAAEFLEARALQSQTGQPSQRFGGVVVKELLDNALDACESAKVAPVVELGVTPVDGVQFVTVSDNGTGMPAGVVERILDFDVLVSDKAAYRSPTRGLQGNAFKTLLGIPYALGVTAPVVIEAHGVRHEVAVSLDPGGNVVVRHDRSASLRWTGTSVTVPLPADLAVPTDRWLQGFAVANPHATLRTLANRVSAEDAVSYKAAADAGWSKPRPTDPTSIHWYDGAALKRLVFAHIAQTRNGARDLPVGEFIRTFDGLTSTAKAKQVRGSLPAVERLSDFETDPALVDVLLKAMQAGAKVPKPARLGHLGEEHLRSRLDAAYGVERFWYKRAAVDHGGIGWVLEVAVAETTDPGEVIYATNYSPAFGDPLGATWLHGDGVAVQGAGSFLARSNASPDGWSTSENRAVVVHVICAAPEFTDKGKVALTVPPAVATVFGETIAKATKVLRDEHKRAERDARKEQNRRARQRTTTEQKVTLKDAVFQVMEQAIADASGNGAYPFPTRNLMYAVRPLIQAYTSAEFKMNYFSQDLVVEWERIHGPIPGHYRDPRGELREPHTGKTIKLGTREVAEYVFPQHVFDKILYVEKEGLNPIFEAAKLAERYDMAIASGKGQAVVAIRELFARAHAGDYQLFVLHDADDAGYIIARAIAEETARMPNHRVDVIDLGLNVDRAVDLRLQTEQYTRRKELPGWMPDRLTEQEKTWFEGRTVAAKQWDCTRVELNALKADIIPYIETLLAVHGATSKVIPPRRILATHARAAVDAIVRRSAEDVLDELGLDLEDITRTVAKGLYKPRVVGVRPATVNRRLRGNSPDPWRATVIAEVNRRLDHDKVKARVTKLIAERVAGQNGGAS